jgi:toxin ParE1/3/4
VSRRYILSDPAVHDLDIIKAYLVEHASVDVARHVLREIRTAMQFLATTPEAGHLRQDLTDHPVKFWPVFSYLIVYDPTPRPLEVVRVLHAARDVAAILETPDKNN